MVKENQCEAYAYFIFSVSPVSALPDVVLPLVLRSDGNADVSSLPGGGKLRGKLLIDVDLSLVLRKR